MKKVITVRFKQSGKTYYFDPAGMDIKTGDHVIVETARGTECAEVVQGVREVPDSQVVKQLKSVTRMADAVDVRRMRQNRELVKDLAGVFHTRIELRQIGVRDESKMLGGIGICGQVFCCSRFLKDFQPVSIKMAKEQGLSLNPAKISGACGRLMCCLAYEQKSYEYLNSLTPQAGSVVRTPDGEGTVLEANPISGILKVRAEGSILAPKFYHRDECQYLYGGKKGRKGPKPAAPAEQPAPAQEAPAAPAEEKSGEE